MKNYKLAFILTAFFMIAIINIAMANATWPAQSTWDTTFGRATIIIKDGKVTGIYNWNDGRFLNGRLLNGAEIVGEFIEYQLWSNDILREGKYDFILSPDGQSFQGTWSHKTDPPHTWMETWTGGLVSTSDTITLHLDATWPDESTWLDVDGNTINIKIENGNVTGIYTGRANGTLDGTLSADGKFVSGHWNDNNNSGRYSFKLSHDGQSFSGRYCLGEDDPLKTNESYSWRATLIK